MSKHGAIAFLLVEAARQSFALTGEHRILSREWDDVCSKPDIQASVASFIRQPSGFFKKKGADDPSSEDFDELRLELREKLSKFERRVEIRALFHEYEAEKLLYPDDWEMMSEGMEELVIERLIDDFRENGY